MWILSFIPFLLQGLAIGIDELWFHQRRGLPRWERVGHPLDTLTVILCMAFVVLVPYCQKALIAYCLLATFSSIFVTKDEFVHNEVCPASEQWLHAVLFLLHPPTLIAAGLLWPISQGIEISPWFASWIPHNEMIGKFLLFQLSSMILFLFYQIIFWNFIWKERPHEKN